MLVKCCNVIRQEKENLFVERCDAGGKETLFVDTAVMYCNDHLSLWKSVEILLFVITKTGVRDIKRTTRRYMAFWP